MPFEGLGPAVKNHDSTYLTLCPSLKDLKLNRLLDSLLDLTKAGLRTWAR